MSWARTAFRVFHSRSKHLWPRTSCHVKVTIAARVLSFTSNVTVCVEHLEVGFHLYQYSLSKSCALVHSPRVACTKRLFGPTNTRTKRREMLQGRHSGFRTGTCPHRHPARGLTRLGRHFACRSSSRHEVKMVFLRLTYKSPQCLVTPLESRHCPYPQLSCTGPKFWSLRSRISPLSTPTMIS